MSDETPVPGELAIGDHLAGYRLANTGSGQLQAVKIGQPI